MTVSTLHSAAITMGAPGKPETLLWNDRWGSLQEAVDACIEAMEVTGR